VTTADLRAALKLKRVGGSTWIAIARVLKYHGFIRQAQGWVRVAPSPKEDCPSYRALQQVANDRRARCRAALIKEPKDQNVYEPVHRDPTIQDPFWSTKD
jgi:hypothetical protein